VFTFLKALGWGSTFALIWIVSIPLRGLLISATWGWFISPIFGVRPISISEGIGLVIFFSAMISLTGLSQASERTYRDSSVRRIGAMLLGRAVALGITAPFLGLITAWVWHVFHAIEPLLKCRQQSNPSEPSKVSGQEQQLCASSSANWVARSVSDVSRFG
jgi:hypothetical protein